MSSNSIPVCGDVVEILGLQRRSELNGSVAKVIGMNPDHADRVMVSVGDTMKMIHASRLQRLRASTPQASPEQAQHVLGGSPLRPRSCASSSSSHIPRLGTGMSRAALPKAGTESLRRISRTPSLAGRSASTPSLGSEGLDPGSLEYKKRKYAKARAAWMQTYTPALQREMGYQLNYPRVATDATTFAKEFQEATGMPMHIAFPTEEVTLHDRTGQLVPKWK
mmetsp:Transcript_59682/g.134494  ORF Transcript_59682/g.134494 Transcript_59682/m.134494 type:complete len:222 (-) Transcript_59682:87-752(-)